MFIWRLYEATINCHATTLFCNNIFLCKKKKFYNLSIVAQNSTLSIDNWKIQDLDQEDIYRDINNIPSLVPIVTSGFGGSVKMSELVCVEF